LITKIDTGNTTGITRNMDELNRIVIPKEILTQLKIENKEVAIYPLRKGVYIEFVKNNN
jgi:bifunctional DNA-binding transcriptional regulator/antitoxin component of YhaV-PrlF toxin-antitoxin module